MIRPVLAGGRAPAATAAVLLAIGTWAGAFASSGAPAGALLIAVSAGALARNSRGGSSAARVGFAALWFGSGFLSGRARIAEPAEVSDATYAALPGPAASAAIVEGRLADFWSGRPPRARTTLRAFRVRDGGVWRPFPAEVTVFVAGESPIAGVADRGDRVRVTGRLDADDVPPSERELRSPWRRYRMSSRAPGSSSGRARLSSPS